MRKVKVKEESEKWPLIIDRSSQQATNMSNKSRVTPGGESVKDSNHPCTTASAALPFRSRQHPHPHLHHRLCPTIFISLFLAIGLLVFDIIPRENVIFCFENNGSHVVQCEFYCDALSSCVSNASNAIGATTATSCNCDTGCVGLGEFNVNGCGSSGVLPQTTTATTAGIESEIIFDSGDTPHTPQPGVTAPPHPTPHTIGRTRPVGVGLREFDVNEYVFDENEFNHEINNIFDNLECDLTGVLQATATVTTITNENKNGIKYENGHTCTNTPYNSISDRNDRMVSIGEESRKLIILDAYVMVIWIQLDTNMLFGMFIFIFFFFLHVLW